MDNLQNIVEPEPAYLESFAGAGLEKLRVFASELITHGDRLGLIGPLELRRIWTRHIINSALLSPLLRVDGVLADIGTGGGFPGIVLAVMRPDVQVKMIEPMERRCNWLHNQIVKLELPNATVLRGRAEEFHGAFEVDQVTARAVTALKKLIPITAPLLKDGGEMLFLKGAGVATEIEGSAKAMKKHGVVSAQVKILGDQITEPTRVFHAVVKRH